MTQAEILPLQLEMETGLPKVRDVLGRVRDVTRVFPDGSWNCPFCSYAARAPGCENPACTARVNPTMPIESARIMIEAAERQAATEQERAHIAEWREQRLATERAETARRRDELAALASEKGACLRCLFQPGWEYRPIKFVVHKKPCPRAAAAAAARAGQRP